MAWRTAWNVEYAFYWRKRTLAINTPYSRYPLLQNPCRSHKAVALGIFMVKQIRAPCSECPHPSSKQGRVGCINVIKSMYKSFTSPKGPERTIAAYCLPTHFKTLPKSLPEPIRSAHQHTILYKKRKIRGREGCYVSLTRPSNLLKSGGEASVPYRPCLRWMPRDYLRMWRRWRILQDRVPATQTDLRKAWCHASNSSSSTWQVRGTTWKSNGIL